MKRINKILFLVALVLCTNSCTVAVTNMLWERLDFIDRVESFFIDKEKNKVVLIGVGKFKDVNDYYHYSITDKSGTIVKIFEIGQKSESGVLASFYGSTVQGSKVDKVWIAFGMKTLKREDKEFLDKINKSPGKKLGDFGISVSKDIKGKIRRYPSSKEKFKNICSKTNKNPDCSPIVKLGRPWQGSVGNAETLTSFFGKLIVTPVTLAADILLTPLNAVVFIWASKNK